MVRLWSNVKWCEVMWWSVAVVAGCEAGRGGQEDGERDTEWLLWLLVLTSWSISHLPPVTARTPRLTPHASHLTPHSSRLNLGLLSVTDITGPQFCHLVNIGRGQRAELYNVWAQYRDKKPLQLYQLLLANVNLNLITHRKHFQRGYFPVSVMLWCPTLFTHVWGPIIDITHKYLLSYSYFISYCEIWTLHVIHN